MCVQILNTIFNLDLPIGGGSGDSIDDPVKIELTEENNYVGIEYNILESIGACNGYQWEVIGQKLHLLDDGKRIDQLITEITEWDSDSKEIKNYYFDITECFERSKREITEYLRSK